MLCKVDTFIESVNNNLKNRLESKWRVRKSKNVQESRARLKETDAHASLDTDTHSYFFKLENGELRKIDQSITERFVKDEDFEFDDDVPANAGTFIHSLVERIGKLRTGKNVDDPVYGTFEMRDIELAAFKGVKGDFQLTDDQFEDIVAVVDDMLKQAQIQQDEINTINGTDESFEAHWEQILVDPTRDVAGTIDILISFSDNTAAIYDIKTFSTTGVNKKKGILQTDNYFDLRKQKKQKTQLYQYAKILKNVYGFSAVTAGRIVPIHLDFQLEKDEDGNIVRTEKGFIKRASKFKTIETGVEGSNYYNENLYTHSRLEERINSIRAVNDFLSGLYNSKKRYQTLIRANPDLADTYIAEIKRLDKDIAAITQTRDFTSYLTNTKKMISSVRDTLNKYPSLSETTPEVLKELNVYKDNLAVVLGLPHKAQRLLEIIEDKDADLHAELSAEIKEVMANASLLYEDIITRKGEILTADMLDRGIVNRETDFKGDRMVLINDGNLRHNFGTEQDFDNALIKYLHDLKNEVFDKVRNESEEYVNKLNDLEAAALQALGNERKRLIELMIDSEKLHLHSNVDFRAYYRDQDAEFEKINDDTSLSDAEKLKAKAAWRMEHFELQENYEERYKKAREKKLQDVTNHYSDIQNDTFREARIDDAMEKFDNKYDLSLNEKGVPNRPSAWMKKTYLKLKSEVKERYETDAFKRIKQIPEVLAYWEYYTETMEGALKDLQIYWKGGKTSEYRNTFLPYIRKDLIERVWDDPYMDNDTLDKITSVFGEAFNLNKREHDAKYGFMTEEGDIIEDIPIYWTNPFRAYDEYGRYDETASMKRVHKEKSLDIRRNLQMFKHMSLLHKYRQETEPYVLSTVDALQQSNQFELRELKSSGGFVSNITTAAQNKLGDSETGLKEYLKTMIRLNWYGQNYQNKDFQLGKFSLTETLRKMKVTDTMKSLGFSIIPAVGSYITGRTGLWIESSKGSKFNSEQLDKALLNAGIGWNSVKRAFGTAGAERSKYLAFTHLFDITSSDVLEQYNKDEPEGLKNQLRNIFKNQNYKSRDIQSRFRSYVDSKLVMNIWSAPDEHIDNILLNAMAYNYVVDMENGDIHNRTTLNSNDPKYKTIWDIVQYDREDGLTFDKGNLTDEQLSRAFHKFRRAVRGQQGKIKGSMNPEDKAKYQTNIYASIMMQFRSWIPATGSEWWGNTRYNSVTDSLEGGRWRALGEQFYEEGALKDTFTFMRYIIDGFLPVLKHLVVDIATFTGNRLTLGSMKHISYAESAGELFQSRIQEGYYNFITNNPHLEGISIEQYAQLKAGQMTALARYATVIASLYMLIAALGGDWDDDGEPDYKESYPMRKLMQLMIKTRTESMFYSNPMDAYQMTRNSIPMLGLVVDFFAMGSNGLDETRDFLFGEDSKKDKTPPMYRFIKMIPGNQVLTQIVELYEQDSSYLIGRK